MKKLNKIIIILFLVFFSFSIFSTAQARSYRTKSSDVKVRGYYKKNGSYVAPYYRSKSDGKKYNNYSCIDYGRCR